MNINSENNPRRSIRLKGYDYSKKGLYFITACTHTRACIFGEIKYNKMILNDAGRIADKCWIQIPEHFPYLILHTHIIMPNHIHGIIELNSTNVGVNNNSTFVGANNYSPENKTQLPFVGANNYSPMDDNTGQNVGAKNISPLRERNTVDNGANIHSPIQNSFRSPSGTIGSIVRGFKIGVTKWFRSNTSIKTVWQRNYYEHIVRHEKSYYTIADYIWSNPASWKEDKFYTIND